MRFVIDLYYSLHRLFTIIRPTRIRWKLLSQSARRPVKAYPHDGAFDIVATEAICLKPGDHTNVGTGIAVEVGPGWSYDIRGRSGLSRQGIIVALGLADAHYHGEIRAVLSNLSGVSYSVHPGERIGQIKFNPVFEHQWEQVDEFEAKSGTRGMKGWGSSGR